MSERTLLKNGLTIEKGQRDLIQKDILIQGSEMIEVHPKIIINDAHVIDCEGKVILPGFIDMQAHICESWSDMEQSIERGTKCALKGGFTTICAMSDTNPPMDNEGMIGIAKFFSKQSGWTHVIPAACATHSSSGECMTEIGTLISAGAGLIFDSGKDLSNTEFLKCLLQYMKMFDVPLFLHCEEPCLSEGGVINEGLVSTKLGMPGIPSVAEEISVSKALLLSEYVDCPIHISHITSTGSVRLIRDAKQRGVKVSCDTTFHHIDLSEEDISCFNTNYKVSPPLRTENDRLSLIEGLKDGTIDALVTDHTPCSEHSKNQEFQNAPFGIVGLETAFHIAYKRLVIENDLPLSFLSEKMTLGPAKILNIDKGFIDRGTHADCVIIDLNQSVKMNGDNLVSHKKNTPYLGQTFQGAVMSCMVDGEFRYLNGEFIKK